MVSVHILLRDTRINERSQVLATVNVRDGSDAFTPATVEWRLHNKTRGLQIADWTSVTAASQVTISISALLNNCRGNSEMETMEVTVVADRGLATQASAKATYNIVQVVGTDMDELQRFMLDEAAAAILDESGELIEAHG